MSMKSFHGNNDPNELDEVERIIQPLAAKLLENPEVYAIRAASVYIKASINLYRRAQIVERRIQTARKYMRYGRNIVSAIRLKPDSITKGKYYSCFCRRLYNVIVLLQKMDNQPWLDIIEKDIQAITKA